MYLYMVRSATPLQGCCLVTPRSSSQPWFFAVLPDDGAEQDAYLLQAPLDQLRCWESHMNWDYTGTTLWMGVWQPKNATTLCKTQIFRILLQGNRWLKRTTDQNVVPINCDVKSPSIVGYTIPKFLNVWTCCNQISPMSGHRYHWAFQHQ